MTDMRPYHSPQSVPLTVGARFIRGFKRVGIVAGVLVVLCGVAMTFIIAWEQQTSAERKFEQASCVADLVRNKQPFKINSYDKTRIDYAESGCSGWFTYEPVETVLAHARTARPAPLEYVIQPFSIGLAVSLACAAVTYFGFWMIGWLCAGFTRD